MPKLSNKTTNSTLVHVNAGYFRAGLVVKAGVVVRAAPIIGWAKGKQYADFLEYANSRKWRVSTS